MTRLTPTEIAIMEQPAPMVEGPSIWPSLLRKVDGALEEALLARRELGIERYGQELHRDDGRPYAVDAAQEALDLLVYLERLLLRLEARGDRGHMHRQYTLYQCQVALMARFLIADARRGFDAL